MVGSTSLPVSQMNRYDHDDEGKTHMGKIEGMKVAVLVDDGFEQVEFTSPVDRLRKEGANVTVISPKTTETSVRSWKDDNWGDSFPIDESIEQADPNDYDALLLPGGVINPDRLRRNSKAVSFVRTMFDAKKPVAAICHGPWMLVEAGVVNGRDVTSFPSIRTDLENAGGTWHDKEVVVDLGLLTSRSPEDLDAFNDKLVEEIGEGLHERRTTTTGEMAG